MPTTIERFQHEQQFHDAQAQERAITLEGQPERYRFTDAEYRDHALWIRPALIACGDVRGRRVLDFGAGHGMAAIVLARAGAEAHACDLSPGYVQEIQRRAAANGVTVQAVVGNGESLPYPDAFFDVIWGNAILHHLDMRTAARELHRLLRPGGVAVFSEPWGGNPIVQFARRWLPYPGKHRTPDEQPLRPHDLVTLAERFPRLQCQGFQLLTMLQRFRPSRSLPPGWQRWDDHLLRRWPSLQKFCRYVVLTLPKG